MKYIWARLENEYLKDKTRQQKSELASSSEFYFSKYHLKRLCVYTNDATITENILGNARLKLPSEPGCRELKKPVLYTGTLFLPTLTLLCTSPIHLPDS